MTQPHFGGWKVEYRDWYLEVNSAADEQLEKSYWKPMPSKKDNWEANQREPNRSMRSSFTLRNWSIALPEANQLP